MLSNAQLRFDTQRGRIFMKLKLKLRAWLLIAMIVVLGVDYTLTGTFAWFSDTVEVTENVVAGGNLDAVLQWADGKQSPDGAAWQDASKGQIFDYDKWEPGYVAVRHLHVENAGTLAFKYQLAFAAAADVTALADVIDVYVVSPAREIKSRQDLSNMTPVCTLTEALSGTAVTTGDKYLLAGQGATMTIALKMREEAGNEYQNLLLGSGVAVQLMATQYAYEEDSFGKDYDAEAVFPSFSGNFMATADITGKVSGNRLTEDVTIGSPAAGMYAIVPKGTQLVPGTTKLVLKVDTTTRSDEIEMTMGQVSRSLDVHIDGIADNNTVAATIHLGPVMPIGYQAANIQLYHVEGSTPKQMKAVDTLAAHNQFTYDAETGNTTVMMATFSEVTAVVAANDSWTGERTYGWYNNRAAGDEYVINSEEDFAGFAAIVGGMAEGIEQDDFSGKTVKLGKNLNLGGMNNKIWYPVGYHNSTGKYDKVSGGSVSSDVSSFEGIFDGQGYTISDIYQNTWEMFGDYNSGYSGTPNHYKDGMGIFGFVYNGTIKNLTVDNFQSDGEFCTTGCVAAYAAGSSNFENINIYNSNPRAYNVPNGGVVGYAYAEASAEKNEINFTGVKVHSSTKITALWGSWDVGCGGILGRVNGDATVKMTNCEVAAVIDVFNDVCGNYQYYQYRYSGMLIGTVGDDGDPTSGPEKVNFTNVKVYIGDWANYYYCEFEENTQGSYTDDFQFSRVERNEIVFGELNRPDGCTHTHTKEEEKLAVYLPFLQLYTGYGWGASPVFAKDNVEVTRYFYSVTYMDATGEELFDTEYVINGDRSDEACWAYEHQITKSQSTPNSTNKKFNGWVNAGSLATTVISAGNRNDIVLFESWTNPYTARFVDHDGNVFYSETFTKDGTDPIDPPAVPKLDNVVVPENYAYAWYPDPTNVKALTGDTTFMPSITYVGKLKFEPVDDPADGIIDYYKVVAVSKLDATTEIPGEFEGLPVKIVEKLYKNDNNWDFGSGVTTIIIGEGVERLDHNALSHTSSLKTVKLPSTINYLDKNVFSRNTIGDWKKLTINFNGTMDQFRAIYKHEDWHNGLKTGTKVICSDGEFTLDSFKYTSVGADYVWDPPMN